MRMGRPTFDMFCLVWSKPSPLQTVAMKFGTDTLFSATYMPSAVVRP